MNYRLTELKVLLFLLLLPAVSCQRPMYDEEDDEDGVSQTNLPLKISARSSGESPINYPAYIYAFAEDGSCSCAPCLKNQSKQSVGKVRVQEVREIIA